FNTILPNTDITRYSFLAGAFIEVFLFTLILTNRYIDVNSEKVVVQDALLKEKEKNELHLQAEIDKQTKHLQDANLLLREQKDELEETKKLLTIESQTDMLSGLYNRRYFFEASQTSFYNAIRYEQDLSLLMIDIDSFKVVNDTYGHIIGDEVIRMLSNTLRITARNGDIIARYGGEEFIILLPHTNKQDTYELAERIRIEIEKETIVLENNPSFNITVSIGLTQLNKKEDTEIASAILRCDEALYQAKNSGKNKICIL
ncbi:diguanylate cyclase, partial [Sulfurimonas sp.]|nr:diguanylate cyclase [Sulfurimonas sp.]